MHEDNIMGCAMLYIRKIDKTRENEYEITELVSPVHRKLPLIKTKESVREEENRNWRIKKHCPYIIVNTKESKKYIRFNVR
ncbi:hypothetical protein I7I48_09385 [Histoplasma ohiense]|nr:hypothetical protein I7I48_09385 [Histoplasma ohiense (nom. inval.)]